MSLPVTQGRVVVSPLLRTAARATSPVAHIVFAAESVKEGAGAASARVDDPRPTGAKWGSPLLRAAVADVEIANSVKRAALTPTPTPSCPTGADSGMAALARGGRRELESRCRTHRHDLHVHRRVRLDGDDRCGRHRGWPVTRLGRWCCGVERESRDHRHVQSGDAIGPPGLVRHRPRDDRHG